MIGMKSEPGRSVASKVAAIMLAFADCDTCTVTELSRRTGLPLSTCHRLVAQLAAQRLLERIDDARYLRPGLALRVLA